MDGQNLFFSFFGRPSITFTTLSSSSSPPSFIHLFIHPLTLIQAKEDRRKKILRQKRGKPRSFCKETTPYVPYWPGRQAGKFLGSPLGKNICQVCRLRFVCTFIKSNEVFRKVKSIGKKVVLMLKRVVPKKPGPSFFPWTHYHYY